MSKPNPRGGDRIAASLAPGEYTRATLAERVGMPFDTLRRWLRAGEYVPHESGRDETRGKVTYHVFTESDVTNLRAMCKDRGVRHRARALPPATTN